MNSFAFQWHITDACDQRCKHCYIYAEDRVVPLAQMSFSAMREVLDNCVEAARALGRQPYFYLAGGDPLLHPDFWRLLELLSERRLPFAILGNPFHLDEEVCRRLAGLGCDKYQLSLDGLRATHDGIRKPGSFEATLSRIPMIRAAGMTCAVMATVSRRNVEEIPALVSLAVEREVDVFAFARFCPAGTKGAEELVSAEDYRALLERCWALFERYRDRGTTFSLKDHLWTAFLQEKGLFSPPVEADPDTIYDGCNCGNSHLTILPGGDVYACRRMESRIGDALHDRLDQLFLGPAMERFRQYHRFEKCGRCDLLRFCRGCPAVAHGLTGNMYAPDPQCWKVLEG